MSELHELPEGWEWKTLDETYIVKDGTHDSPKYVKENGYPLYTSKNLKNNRLDTSNFKLIKEEDYQKINKRSKVNKGDLLFAMIGTIGNPTIIEFEPKFAIKNVALFKPKSDDNSIEILRYYLGSNTIIKKMINEAKGATQKFVGLTYLRKFPFPSIPLQEQKRIVAKLDALFEKIDQAITLHQQNIDEADAFMGSVLNEVFGELDKIKLVPLKDITSKIGSGSTPRGGQKSYKTEGISLIRSMNVHDAGFRTKGLAFIDNEQAKKLNNVTVEENDVLLNITGASVARCCIVDKVYLPARVNQHVSIIRLKEDMLPKFLHYYLISPSVKADLLFSSSGGATREAITKSMLESFEVPFIPLKTQQKTVTYLDKLSDKTEQVKALQTQKMQSLKDLKASILDRAFRGEM